MPFLIRHILCYPRLVATLLVITLTVTIQHTLVQCDVLLSTAEAETSVLFHNTQNATSIYHLLIAMCYPQPPTPLKTVDQVTAAFINQDIQHKMYKAWNMHLWWFKDKIVQQYFKKIWDQGANNLTDYFTKYFAPQYHRALHQWYIYHTKIPNATTLNNALPMTPQSCVGTPVALARA